jgi:hypothetical protein
VRLNEMIDTFKRSGKIACFLAIPPPFTCYLAGIGSESHVREFRTSDRSEIWINVAASRSGMRSSTTSTKARSLYLNLSPN